jgi:nucleoside-diphosphate-sugar epimerase
MQGTANLVEVARRAGVNKFVLVSSIGADEPFFPLNLLFGVGPSKPTSQSWVYFCICRGAL